MSIVLKYGSLSLLELSRPVQACNWIAAPLKLSVLFLESGYCEGILNCFGKGNSVYKCWNVCLSLNVKESGPEIIAPFKII